MKKHLILLVIFSVCSTLKINAQATLNYFIGYQLSTNIELYWETSSETNIDYYDLSFSTDFCISFAPFTPIPGNGTTSSTSNYSYTLTGPLIDMCYCFRLSAVDFSGNPYYLDTTMVCYNSGATLILESDSNSDYNIYPNPANASFVFETQQINAQLIITDVLGKTIYSEKIVQPRSEIKTEKFINGIYYMNYSDNVQKLVIRH